MPVPRHILIVEDDASIRQLLEVVLRRSGYATTSAVDGEQALELMAVSKFDLLVLDLALPVLSGQEVIARLAESGEPTPVIVCTAAAPSVIEALDRSVVRVAIRKPFDLSDLMKAIESLTSANKETAVATVLIIDDDEPSRYVLRRFAEPANVVETGSAEEALDVVREHRPDAVILDLSLPGMQGEELLRKLKADPATAKLPVVVVTSRKLSSSDMEPTAQLAEGYIYKGDLSRELLQSVLAVIVRNGDDEESAPPMR